MEAGYGHSPLVFPERIHNLLRAIISAIYMDFAKLLKGSGHYW